MNLNTLTDTPPWEWPESAGPFLHRIVRDRGASTSDRLLAAELCGELTVMNDELAETLLTIVESGDEAEELRGRAVISLAPTIEYADTTAFDDPDDSPISEEVFDKICQSLHRLYSDVGLPVRLRQNVLEASVRVPEEWHQKEVRAAYYSGDPQWRTTAVFCMNFVEGFDREILEALHSEDADVHYEAVCAAGVWELDGAWPHIARLIKDPKTDKLLLLAAIEAVALIRPQDTASLLVDLTTSNDEDIVEAAFEAMSMAEGIVGPEIEGEDEDED